MDLNAGQLTWSIYSSLVQWTNGAYGRIPDIRWHDFVRNVNIRGITNQPPLSSIIKSRCLTFFGHLAQMDENADASQDQNLLQKTGSDHRDGRAQPG